MASVSTVKQVPRRQAGEARGPRPRAGRRRPQHAGRASASRDDALTLPFLPVWGLSVALASGGSLPITSLDATGNLVFANAGGAPNIVTAPLFLNPQNLSLLTSNPVSLVSAAAASAGNSGPVASLHVTSASTESIQSSLFTVASASGAASTTTTASKAQ